MMVGALFLLRFIVEMDQDLIMVGSYSFGKHHLMMANANLSLMKNVIYSDLPWSRYASLGFPWSTKMSVYLG